MCVKKNKKKKNGFTLVEVIAAVTILGILSAVAIPSVSKVMGKGHSEYCQNNVDVMKTAARDYFNDYKSLMPKEVGDSETVTMKDLVKEKYLDKMTDYDEKECTSGEVRVLKTTRTNYEYTYKLDCGKCNGISDEDDGKIDPNAKIDINYSPFGGTRNNPLEYNNKDANITISFDYKNVTIYSYKYEIHRVDISGDQTVGGITNYKDYKGKDIKVKLDSKGVYYIKTYVVNSSQNRIYSKNSGYFSLDYKFTCNDISLKATYDGDGKTKNLKLDEWHNGAFKFNFSKKGAIYNYDVYLMTDTNDKSKAELVVSKSTGNKSLNFPNSLSHTYKFYIIAYNEEGEQCQTDTFKYKQDNIEPDCITNSGSYNHEWTNQDVTIYGNPKDKGNEWTMSGPKNVGDKLEGYATNTERTFTEDMDKLVSPGSVSDAAGNIKVCPAEQLVRIDKTPPECTTSGGNAPSWTNQSVTIYGSCSDPIVNGARSDCRERTINRNINYEVDDYLSPGTITDIAGNSTDCEEDQHVQIDKTAPTCESECVSGNCGTWTNEDVEISGTCSDDGDVSSGCAQDDFDYTEEATDGKIVNKSVSPSGGPIYDNAGNTATCPEQKIMIDAAPPNITCTGEDVLSRGTAVNSENLKGHAKVSASDQSNGSGLAENPTGDKQYTSAGSTEYIARDNAGNECSCTIESTGKQVYKYTYHSGCNKYCNEYYCNEYNCEEYYCDEYLCTKYNNDGSCAQRDYDYCVRYDYSWCIRYGNRCIDYNYNKCIDKVAEWTGSSSQYQKNASCTSNFTCTYSDNYNTKNANPKNSCENNGTVTAYSTEATAEECGNSSNQSKDPCKTDPSKCNNEIKYNIVYKCNGEADKSVSESKKVQNGVNNVKISNSDLLKKYPGTTEKCMMKISKVENNPVANGGTITVTLKPGKCKVNFKVTCDGKEIKDLSENLQPGNNGKVSYSVSKAKKLVKNKGVTSEKCDVGKAPTISSKSAECGGTIEIKLPKKTEQNIYLCRVGNTYVHKTTSTECTSGNCSYTVSHGTTIKVEMEKHGRFYKLISPHKGMYLYDDCTSTKPNGPDCISRCRDHN